MKSIVPRRTDFAQVPIVVPVVRRLSADDLFKRYLRMAVSLHLVFYAEKLNRLFGAVMIARRAVCTSMVPLRFSRHRGSVNITDLADELAGAAPNAAVGDPKRFIKPVLFR